MKQNKLLQHAVILPLQDGISVAVVEVEDLPSCLGGLSLPLGAGLYLVCLAATLPDRKREKVFLHELSHVMLGHLEQDGKPVSEKEAEADQTAADLIAMQERGQDSPELELLRLWTEQRGQVVPLRA